MKIPSLKVSFGNEEVRKEIIANIEECLATGMVSQGKFVQQFEECLAKKVGVKHAIAVNSGSSAIEIVMRTLGVKGKDVLVPTNTFLATAAGVIFAGGNARLVDVDPKTFSVSLEELKKRVTDNTAGVIIVHIGGIITPEMEKIKEWCDERGIWLYEDAAHAIGCSLNGTYAGTFGIAGSYSLFATKVITCGEGGAIVTNDDDLAAKIRLFRNHGKPESWETFHTSVGSNYRMSDIVGTIALSQIERLDEVITERERIADVYSKLLEEKMPELEIIKPADVCNWYKYIVLLPEGIDRKTLKDKMKEKGISLQGEVYGIPLHRQPIAEELGFVGEYPKADDVCSRHICLPLYPGLTEDQLSIIIDELCATINELK